MSLAFFVPLFVLASLGITGCAVPAGVYGLGPLKVTSLGLNDQEIGEGLARYHGSIEDPNGYLEYLGPREFVLASAVFDAYARTVDPRPEWINNPVGGYIGGSYLDTKAEKIEFRQRLHGLGLLPAAISFYESLFASWDVVIFHESILAQELFLEVLPHERLHRAMRYLSRDEFLGMRQAAEELMDRRVQLPEPVTYVIDGEPIVLRDERFVEERWYPKKKGFGFYISAAVMNWEEFYAYLAQGEFEPFVEEALAKDYPEQYGVFVRLREKCALANR